jgi:outer membrane protein assembly factor BamD
MGKILLSVALVLLFAGCSSKQEKISDQTALFWHNRIYKSLDSVDLDKADEALTSLELEHPKSEFIKQDLLALYKAHKDYEDYELAKFYLNEYKKRYARKYEYDWCDYKELETDFFSISNSYTNQVKIDELISKIENYKKIYPNGRYISEADTILIKLTSTKLFLNKEISNLYKKLDYPNAAKIYDNNTSTKDLTPPYVPWYKSMFYW